MTYTVYFDLETGGIEMRHPVIQLAAIAVDEALVECGTFEQKITFDPALCDPDALAVNHYTAEAWANAHTPWATISAFNFWLKPFSSLARISPRTGAGYNLALLAGFNSVTFDGPRLKALYAGQFFPCSYQIRDVLQRAFWWFDERALAPDDFKLTTLCRYFNIPTDGAHDALTDVRLTIALARALRNADDHR